MNTVITMSNKQRKKAIQELITYRAVTDQEMLVRLLHEHHGIVATQSAVSRDLKQLNIIKMRSTHGMRYELPSVDVTKSILELAIITIHYNEALIVIETVEGLAAFVGDYLDQAQEIDLLGCIAGENAVFVAPRSVKKIEDIYKTICSMLYYRKK
jgi:transcriptional regulator of arginine metabolism